MPDNQIATPLQGVPHMVAFDELAKTRFSLIALENILVTMFDTVDSSLLDILAEQYDMLGYNGWILAENDTQKRELLKAAVGLKKIMGTPAGIREVIKRLGFLDVVIEEGWENFTDGSDEPDTAPWAYFRVVYVLPGDKSITEDVATSLVGLINQYKNARSKLANFGFSIPQKDSLLMRGEVTLRMYDTGTGDLISTEVIANTIKDAAMYETMKNVASASSGEETGLSRYRINKIGFGTASTADTIYSPTAVTGGVTKLLDDNPSPPPGVSFGDRAEFLSGGSVVDRYWLRHFFSLTGAEGNGSTLRELGLIMVDVNGQGGADKLYARIVRAPIVKTSAIRLEGWWDIYFYPNQTGE